MAVAGNVCNKLVRALQLVGSKVQLNVSVSPTTHKAMKLNIGNRDRVLRILLAALIISATFVVPIMLVFTYIIYGIAAVLLVTGIIGFCPIYKLFSISTHATILRRQTEEDAMDVN
jgi:hypothetical protein